MITAPQATDSYHYIAGRDTARAQALMAAFAHSDIGAVICTRGGFGSGRILDLLDYDVIAANPKPVVGFSDSTGLHLALLARCGLIGITGALADTDLSRQPPPAATTESLWQLLTRTQPLGSIASGPDVTVLRHGSATGSLIPANLALLCSLLGTPYAPDLTGAILLVEDVWEVPYRLDRMFTQLRLAGILDQIHGLALGIFRRCFVPEEMDASPTLEEIVLDAVGDRPLPILNGVAYGHMSGRLSLPIGALSRLETDPPGLSVLEAAVEA
ncbi:MAG: LD-carboxypeptidase [Gemmatimonadetes bacterium]|nr:LD-carboxypeptidase [Gemmatimonadota bacterium]